MPLESIKTPCIGVCRMDEWVGICVGCGRSRIEIGAWAMMSDSDRDAAMQVAEDRLNAFFNNEGQNNAKKKNNNSR
jgi:predicted Fe-S protein YdhL (DUF1289 family)